jgi:hypothetical protein
VIVRLAVHWLALFHVSDGILGQQIVNHSHRSAANFAGTTNLGAQTGGQVSELPL